MLLLPTSPRQSIAFFKKPISFSTGGCHAAFHCEPNLPQLGENDLVRLSTENDPPRSNALLSQIETDKCQYVKNPVKTDRHGGGLWHINEQLISCIEFSEGVSGVLGSERMGNGIPLVFMFACMIAYGIWIWLVMTQKLGTLISGEC